MGHPRTLALYVSAAMLAIVVAALLLLRSGKDRPPEQRLPAQAAGDPKSEPTHDLNPPPAGTDPDWRAAVQAEPAGAGEPSRATADPARAVHVFGFVHTPDGQLAKSIPVQWNRKAQFSLQVEFARPIGFTDPPAESQRFDVVDGHYEGDIPEGTWIVSVAGQEMTDYPKDSGPFVEPVPLLRRLASESRTQIDLDFRPAGTCSVRGTIHDEHGEPFGSLAVELSELHELVEPTTREQVTLPRGIGTAVSADADGSFAISRLPPGRFRLFVEPEGYKPTSPPRKGTVGEVVQPREFELYDGSLSVELTVRRPHPVRVTGRVEIDAAWAAEHGVAAEVPTLELVRSASREGLPDVRDPIPLGAQGFGFWVDAGVREPRLEVHLGNERSVQPLQLPVEGEFAPLTIHFPR